MYNYFLVYFWKTKRDHGVGNCCASIDTELSTMESIREIERMIKQNNNVDKVVLLNFTQLKG